ncbi:monooxygenase [Bordetella pertussis]|nr:monooxygenase [Bordetella pertussis]CPI44364.1 monooxygenase [Bordetella pertussis]CPM18472.1 monooxygenase [Bordetella pertussis]CPM75428.1 monooxygenase [Bordetella pertussis]CPN71114.1 monooxygenase [Bordetella pertussis]
MDTPNSAPLDRPSFEPPCAGLESHAGFGRLFRPAALSIGLILPLETHPDRPAPTMARHVEMAQRAEALGFGALWLRDVPFHDPAYGDVAQIFEPLVYIGYLAAATRRIALGTTGIVLPTHEPMYLAKQAASLDQLSGGRFVLGLSSGDRLSDYPMLGIDYDSRGARYRDAYGVLRTLTEQRFPNFRSAARMESWTSCPSRCMAAFPPSPWAPRSRPWHGWQGIWMACSPARPCRSASRGWRRNGATTSRGWPARRISSRLGLAAIST